MFFAAAAVYAVFGAVSYAQFQIALHQVREARPALHDTYYVVSHGYFVFHLGIAMAVLGAITWIQARFEALLYPTLTKVLFWVLHIAWIGGTVGRRILALALPMPRRYIDYPDYMEILVLTDAWSSFLSLAALIGLLCVLLWSITARWLAR